MVHLWIMLQKFPLKAFVNTIQTNRNYQIVSTDGIPHTLFLMLIKLLRVGDMVTQSIMLDVVENSFPFSPSNSDFTPNQNAPITGEIMVNQVQTEGKLLQSVKNGFPSGELKNAPGHEQENTNKMANVSAGRLTISHQLIFDVKRYTVIDHFKICFFFQFPPAPFLGKIFVLW